MADVRLELSNKKLKNIVKGMCDLMLIFNAAGYCTHVSKINQNIISRSESAFLNKTTLEIFPEHVATQMAAHIKEAKETEKMQSFYYEMVCEEITFHFRVKLLLDEDQDIFVFLNDATRERELEKKVLESQAQMKAVNDELEASLEQLIATEEALREKYDQLEENKKALQSSEERWYFALEGSENGVWDWDMTTNQVFFSNRWKRMMGYTIHEIKSELNQWMDRIHPDDREAVKDKIKSHLKGESSIYTAEYRMQHRSGDYIWISDRGKVMGTTLKGKPLRMVGTHTDITDSRIAKETLLYQKRSFECLFDHTPDAVVQIDREERIVSINQRFIQLFGYTLEEVQGKKINQVMDPDSRITQYGSTQVLQGKTVFFDETIRYAKDGKPVDIMLKGAPIIINGEAVGGYAIYTDISERKRAEEKIRYLSFHDKLTGLYNRAFFDEEIERLDSPRQLPVSIIVGDVNGLKLTNDVFGHEAGDQLLIKIAEIMRAACRKEDLVARWGGDEFAIILPQSNSKIAAQICQRIHQTCQEAGEIPIKISVALGWSTKYKENESIREVIKHAEEKMYRNKLLESKSTRSYIITSLLKSLFEKSHETEEHGERLKELGIRLAKEIQLNDDLINELGLLALLHDIGKIAISDSTLNKKGPLTEDEWEEMKTHPEIGYRIAETSPDLYHIAKYILFHHERWDGGGYPKGLKGQEIPMLSRILAIVDAYDIMTHPQIYRKEISSEEAIAELRSCAGTQFDPELTEVFIRLIEKDMQ